MNLSWIDQYVNGIIEYCCSRDIYDILDTLNIIIKKVDRKDPLLRGNDSIYVRNYIYTEIIFIRDDLPCPFERFVLAHELGHAILHVEVATAAYNRNIINRGKFEKQADYFAIKLLDIRLDDVYLYELSAEQIAGALYVTEDSLLYLFCDK